MRWDMQLPKASLVSVVSGDGSGFQFSDPSVVVVKLLGMVVSVEETTEVVDEEGGRVLLLVL